FGFGETAHGVDVIGLYAVEVVLGLRINHAEDGVGIGFTVDMGDAPIVANDSNVARLLHPTGLLGRAGSFWRFCCAACLFRLPSVGWSRGKRYTREDRRCDQKKSENKLLHGFPFRQCGISKMSIVQVLETVLSQDEKLTHPRRLWCN